MDETTRAQFEAALARLLEGEPEPGDGQWLALAARSDAAVAREVSGLLAIDDLLRQRAAPEAEAFVDGVRMRIAEPRADDPFVRRVQHAIKPSERPASLWWTWPVAIAAVFVALFAVVKWGPTTERGAFAQRLATPASVATLSRGAGVVWNGRAMEFGEALAPGWLRLEAGAVQVDFARGARVVLEGPAELQLIGANEARLHRGRLRAHVPGPARGFTIRAAGFDVVDLGTDFGCVVSESGAAEVHVFTGEVAFVAPGRPEQPLRAAEALRFDGAKTEAIPARADLFLTEAELARRAAEESGVRLAAWRRASAALSRQALLHFDFEQFDPQSRTVANRAAGASDATVIGCELATGRWPGKAALDFQRADDRLRVNIPGEFQAVTLLAWVRAEELVNNHTSLLMSESEQAGDVHWYFYRDGRLGFGVKNPASAGLAWNHIHSEPVLGRGRPGAWICVATTFDPATQQVAHYLDGQPWGGGELRLQTPLRPGLCEIGNWALRADDPRLTPERRYAARDFVRNFRGRIDEFALLPTALSAAEIQRLYELGRPSPAAR